MGAGAGYENPGSTHCFTVTVPQGRKFALLYLSTERQGTAASYGVTISGPAPFVSFQQANAPNPDLVHLFDVSQITASGAAVLQVFWFATTADQTSGDNVSVNGTFHYDVQFLVEDTPLSFRPMAKSDTTASSGVCSPATNCEIPYRARIYPLNDPDTPAATLEFRLKPSCLDGISMNIGQPNGPNPNVATHGDFKFRYSAADQALFSVPSSAASPSLPAAAGLPAGCGQQTLMSLDFATDLTAAVVSEDYGGYAEMEVWANFGVAGQPAWVRAEVIVPTGQAPRTHIRIPVDQNGNRMADRWEQDFSVFSVQNPLPVNGDLDPGYSPTSPKGDGYSNHDEYRGVHYKTSSGSTAWTAMDPGKMDLFYWDTTATTSFAGYFTPRVQDLLEVRLQSFVTMRALTRALSNAPAGGGQ